MKTSNLWRVVLVSLLSVFAFAACSDDETTPPVQTEVTLNVNGENETAVGLSNEAGAVVSVAVEASAKWNLAMESDWCSADIVSGGQGKSEIKFTAASALPENMESREAVATLSAKGSVLGFEYTKTAKITIVQNANGEVPDVNEPLPAGEATIKELVTRGRAGVKYTVKEAVVLAKEFRGSVIGDNSGAYIFVYGMGQFAPFNVGDKISIEGPLQVMWGVPQFSLPGKEPNPNKDATATVLGQGELQVEYKAMSDEEIAKYKALPTTERDVPSKLAYPVTFEGTVSKYLPEGAKFDVYELTTASGVITLEYAGDRELEPLVGQKTTIKGFTVGDEGTTKHGNLKVLPVLTGGAPVPPPTPGGEGTLSHVFENGVKGTAYAVKDATIVAKGERAFVLGDATGFMMVYGATELALNDKVNADGTYDVFWGVGQFKTESAKFEKTGTNEWKYDFKGMTDEEIAAYFAISTADRNKAAKPCKEVMFTGDLKVIEEQGSNGKTKTIYEMSIDGQTSKVAITYNDGAAAALVGKKVTVKGYTVGDEKSRLKVIPYTLTADGETPEPPTPGEAVKIGDIKAAGNYTVNNAVVVNVSEIATVLGDETGYILIYGNNTNKVGDKLNISGDVTVYTSKYGDIQGVYQFDAKTAQVEKVSEGNAMEVTYEAYDKTKVETYIQNFETQFLSCKPIELKGELVKSGDKYYNLNIEGADANVICGSIQYMTPAAEAVGKKVTIKGYAVGWNGSKQAGKIARIKIFPNTITVDGEGGGETPEPPVPPVPPVAGQYVWDAALMADAINDNKSYKEVVESLNGESNVEIIKIGASKNAGVYTTKAVGVTGDKTLEFYATAWSGKEATLYIRVDNGGSADVTSIALKGDVAGFAGTAPYKEPITVTDAEHRVVKLTGLTEASTITFSTSSGFNTDKVSGTRAVIIGAHLK